MTSSCRISRTILSAPREEGRWSALMAVTAAIKAHKSTRNSTIRRIILPPSGRKSRSAGLIVSSNIDERRWGGGAQHGFGIRGGKGFHLGRNVHRTKLRPAHRTEVSIFEAILRQRLIMHGASRLR